MTSTMQRPSLPDQRRIQRACDQTASVIAVTLLAVAVAHVATASPGSVRGDAGTATARNLVLLQVEVPACAWTFVAYHASPVEAAWRENIAHNQRYVCDATRELKNDIKVWLHYTRRHHLNMSELAWRPVGGDDCEQDALPTPPLQPDGGVNTTSTALYNVMSSMEYEWRCEAGVKETTKVANVHVPIEPLAGPLRHPGLCFPTRSGRAISSAFVLRRDYLAFDAWATVHADVPQDATLGTTKHRRPNALYFDVGASTFNDGKGGPSQGYFMEWIRQQCLNITGIFAWEAQTVESNSVWQQIPGSSRTRLCVN